MPDFHKPPERWFPDRLARDMRDMAGQQSQSTEYVVDPRTQLCVAIVGNLEKAPTPRSEAEPNGGFELTGLTGWGIAVKSGAAWVSLAPVAEGWETADLKWSSRAACGAAWIGPCVGQEVAAADYPELAAQLGTGAGSLYGAAAGGNILLPDGRDRSLIGASGTRLLGTTGGAATVTLSLAQIPNHSHTQAASTYFHGAGTKGSAPEGAGTHPLDEGGTTQAVGGGEAHENMPPYIAANLFIHI